MNSFFYQEFENLRSFSSAARRGKASDYSFALSDNQERWFYLPIFSNSLILDYRINRSYLVRIRN